MHGAAAKRLGIYLILMALVPWLVFAVAWMVPAPYRSVAGTVWAVALLVPGALYLWVMFRLWRLAAGGPAARPMGAAILLTVGFFVGSIVIDNAILWFRPDTPLFIERSWLFALATLSPLLLVGVALMRSGWVPDWIPKFGIGWLAIAAVNKLPLTRVVPQVVLTASGWLESAAQLFMLVALGAALIARSRLPDPGTQAPPGQHLGVIDGHAEQALPAGGGYAGQ